MQTMSFCQSLPPDSLAMCQRNICLFLPQFLYPLTFNCFPHSQPCYTSLKTESQKAPLLWVESRLQAGHLEMLLFYSAEV